MDHDLIVHPDRDIQLSQLTAVLGGMSEGVIAFDLQGEFYFANRAILDLYGLERRDEILRHISQLDALFERFDLENNPLSEGVYPAARLMRGERFTDYEMWVKRRGSERRWLASYNGTHVQDSATLCVVSVRDLTVQRELEAHRRATFDVNPTAMSIVRLDDLRFTEVNDSFLKLTGYERDEVIGKTAHELRMFIESEKRDIALSQL